MIANAKEMERTKSSSDLRIKSTDHNEFTCKEDKQTTTKSVFENTAFNEQLKNDMNRQILVDDVVLSSVAVAQSTKNETAYDIPGEDSNIHTLKTKRNTSKVSIKTTVIIDNKTGEKVNSPSGSTITHAEPTINDCNTTTKETDDQTCITAQQNNSKVIGTGPSYIGGGIKNTFHGISYQMKLSMFYIVRGYKQKCKFQVGTEVKKAGKLDDLLFLYEDDEITFIQAKHKLNEDCTINEDQLLSKESDLSISKYFHSYLQILNQNELRNVLENRVMTLMINTNIGIDSSILNYFEPLKVTSGLLGKRFLALSTEIERAEYYTMKESSPLYNKLENLLGQLEVPSNRLAENLAKAVVNNNKKSIKIDELFERYREWLLRNVIEIGTEKVKTQNRYFMIFRDSFLSGSEKNTSDFRNIFLETYLSNKQTGKKDTTSKGHSFNEDTVKQDLNGVKFQVPKVFTLTCKNNTPKSRQDEVRKFLNSVVFAVNQPNENTFGDIIEKEIVIEDDMDPTNKKTVACKFKLYIQDWSKQKPSRYLRNEDIERQFAIWGQENLNQIRMHDIKKHRCTFEESNGVIKNLSNFLKTPNNVNVLCLYNRETLLTKIKVCQVLDSFASENIDQQFIFSDINDLIELENTEKCPVKAFSSQTCNLLFISLQGGKLHNNGVKILNRMLQIAREDKQQKRLILSIPENRKHAFVNQFCFNNLGIKSRSMDDCDNRFNDLDEKSRRLLMEKGHIELHGNNIKSLLSENQLSEYIRDEILLKLISNELEINDALVGDHYNKEINQSYINRSLVPLIVSQDITKDTRFLFVQENQTTPQMNIKNQEIVAISPNAELFEHLRITNVNVHWLMEKNNKYIWITSQGTISNLREYVAAEDLTENENGLPITNIRDLKNDVVLISAIPGMGKSILLSHLAEQSKQENTSMVVFKINLAHHFTELDNLDEENVTLKQAIYFTFVAIRIESSQIEGSESAYNLLTVQEDGSIDFLPNASFDHMDHLRAVIFCNLYNKGKIVLLIDGFNEIAPDYCNTTLNLLHKLKHSKVRKMWVTTRPYGIQESLENYLETFAYTLKPFAVDDQLKFFENFWAHRVKTENVLSSLKDFFNSLNINTLYPVQTADQSKMTANKRISSFMGVPLHNYMLAKVLTQGFIKFCSKSNYNAVASKVIEEELTIFDLYLNFFNIKFDEILYKVDLKDPKYSIFRDQKKRAETEHGKMALLEIFDENLLTELVPDEDRVELKDSVTSGTNKIGVVAEFVHNKPRFVHRTFAEYFAAHYLANILLSRVESKRKEAARSLLYNSVCGNPEYYYVLFTFFNYKIISPSKNKDIFQAAIGGNTQKLVENENMAEMFDALNRTPIHFIAMNLFNVTEDLPNAFPNTDYKNLTTATKIHNMFHNFFDRLWRSMMFCSPDTLFKWKPAHYLTVCPLLHNISEKYQSLLLYLHDVSEDSFGRTPLMLMILSDSLFNEKWIGGCLPENLLGVNHQDHLLKTALHHTLERLKKCPPLLAKKNNCVNEKISYASELIIWLNCLEMICFLLKHGAYVDIPDNEGIKPVDMINSLITKETKYILKDLFIHHRRLVSEGHKYLEDVFYFRLNYIAEQIETSGYNAFRFDVDIAEVNIPDNTGKTALHYAVIQKDKKAVCNLVNNGAQLDIADNEGKRPVNIDKGNIIAYIEVRQQIQPNNKMSYPVPNGDVCTLWFIDELPPEVAERLIGTTDLLTLSADNKSDKDIIIFILTTTKIFARMLLSKCPHLVDVVDSKGRTALHYAIKNRDVHCTSFLITSNASVDIRDNKGKMPAYTEKLNLFNHVQVLQNVTESKEITAQTNDIITLEFIETLPPEVAKPLVMTMNLYPIVTQIDADILVYILSQTSTIARVLLSLHPEAVNTKDSKGRTALHYAVIMKNRSTVCYLISKNAQVDIVDNDGKYPTHNISKLYSAPFSKEREEIRKNSGEKIEEMYEQDLKTLKFINTLPFNVAKPLVMTMDLFPPLIFTFDMLHTIASVLWVGYSDLLRTTTLKKNCPYLNCTKVSNEVVCILLQENFIDDFSDKAVKSNYILNAVVQLFKNVKESNLSGVQTILTSVEYSILRPNLANVDFLIAEVNVAGCMVNAKSKDDRRTTLHYAAQFGNAEIAQCLLSHGASYNARDFHGTTPAQVAKANGNTAVLHLLDMIDVLFHCLKTEAYDVAQSVLMNEAIDGNLFNCICSESLIPFAHLALQQNNKSFLKSLLKCYQCETDFMDCRNLNGVTVLGVINEMGMLSTEVLEFLELPSELKYLIIRGL